MLGNWYEMYWYTRERQKELARQAERLRSLTTRRPPGQPRKAIDALFLALGLLLVRWGTAMQRQGGGSAL